MKPFGTVARNRLGIPAAAPASAEPKPEAARSAVDAAWMVLEAANDLGDHATVDACRRVIDASLNGRTAAPADVQIVLGYFA
jgi:hypothetical protein